jgi:predicted dehydrogenase
VSQSPTPIRWGLVGTANIGRRQFLPGLREAGGGAANPDDVHVAACSAVTQREVEVDAAGVVGFGPAQRLLLTCGFKRSSDTFTRILGSQGQIHLTNPFHPGPADTLTIFRPNADPVVERPSTDERSFTAAIRHIHAVLRGEAAPKSTAGQFSLPAARTLEQLQALAASSPGTI